MGLIGKEVIQSKIYERTGQKPPEGNYKNAYPITITDAVHENWEDGAKTLSMLLEEIRTELRGKQPIFHPKPANYLMTHGGVAGAVGSIQITTDIPNKYDLQSHEKIPTERAIGNLLIKLGLFSADGSVNPEFGVVNWHQILGRPLIYDTVGNDDNGIMSQTAVTRELNEIRSIIVSETETAAMKTIVDHVYPRISAHVNDTNNPHNVNLSQLDGVSKTSFESHVNDTNNPHNVNKTQLGLSEVDNTKDIDKPVSTAVQRELDTLTTNLNDTIERTGKAFVSCSFDIPSGNFELTDLEGNTSRVNIPISGTVIGLSFDNVKEELIVHYLEGDPSRLSFKTMVPIYFGKNTENIEIDIEDDPDSNKNYIRAKIIPKSIKLNDFHQDIDIAQIIKKKSIGEDLITDDSISTIKLKDLSVTDTKIKDLSVSKLNKSAGEHHKVLLSNAMGEDPIWGYVKTNHIEDKAIDSYKLANDSVITSKILNSAVTSDKIADANIESRHLMPGIVLDNGAVKEIPAPDSSDNTIASTEWVNRKLQGLNDDAISIIAQIDNITSMMTPPRENNILISTTDKKVKWGLLDSENISNHCITDIHVNHGSVNADKLMDNSITSRQIESGSIDVEKLRPSTRNNMVVATDNDGKVSYCKINPEMLEGNGGLDVQFILDRSIPPEKIQPSNLSQKVMITKIGKLDAEWGTIGNKMLDDNSVDGRVIFGSPNAHRVLGVIQTTDDPTWLQISSEMIKDKAIVEKLIADKNIKSKHIEDGNIENQHIAQHAISSDKIARRAIGRDELFTSPLPNKVLAVTSMPYSSPDWLSITTEMIEDKAITAEKMFQSTEPDNPCRVLAVTQPNRPPEYILITGDFIVNDSIQTSKLKKDLILRGTPILENHPDADAADREIASTKWIREYVDKKIQELRDELNP